MSARLAQRVLWLLLASLVAAIVVVLVSRGQAPAQPSASPSTSPGGGFAGPLMPPHLAARNFSLTDQNGHRVTLSRYRGRVVVLTFIHSQCHDACPLMVQQIKGALNDLPGNGAGVEAIGVSVAPTEDTAASRRAFLAKMQMTGRLAFLNGPLPVMRQVWHAYAIQPLTSTIEHSTFVLLIDKRGFCASATRPTSSHLRTSRTTSRCSRASRPRTPARR